MTYEKILFHTRFREMAFNCLEAVLALKDAGLKEVVLAHVIPREAVAFVPYGGYLKEHEARLRETAEIRFKEWRQRIEAAGVKATAHIDVGTENANLLEIAHQLKADLIVTGPKKRTLLEHIYVGRHILDILRRSPVPVLMAKYQGAFQTDTGFQVRTNARFFERPLLATDWSAPSHNALEALAAFRPVVQTALIAHVIGRRQSRNANARELERLEHESRQRLAAYQTELKAQGLTAETHLAVGRTVDEILKLSREHQASMIVMGRTGKDWFEEYWLGGVTHRVAECSELPVMVVP